MTPVKIADDVQAVEKLRDAHQRLRQEIGKVIIGQEQVIDQLLMAIFCRSHALLMGVPGLAKTLMVSTLSQALDLTFKRIQFTPDLMPSDITGSEVIQDDPVTRQRMFKFLPGPVFANIVLADEINRTPPKTQAALLEAMQERTEMITVSDRLLDYLHTLVERTRKSADLRLPVSTRGAQALFRATQAYALLAGRDYATPDDVQAVAESVLAHRILSVSADGFGSGGREREVVRKILAAVPVPL